MSKLTKNYFILAVAIFLMPAIIAAHPGHDHQHAIPHVLLSYDYFMGFLRFGIATALLVMTYKAWKIVANKAGFFVKIDQ